MEKIGRLLENALQQYANKKYDKALKILNELLSEQPKFDRGWFLKGVIFEETGKPEEAVECFEKARNLSAMWFRLGLHMEDSDPQKAIACYDRAVKLDERLNMAWLNKGMLHEKLGMSAEAEGCYRKISPWRELFSRVFVPTGFFLFLSGGSFMMFDRGEKTLAILVLAMAFFCLFWLKRDAGTAILMLSKKLKAK